MAAPPPPPAAVMTTIQPQPVNIVPTSSNVKKVDHTLVGQAVTCVIDGIFDNGVSSLNSFGDCDNKYSRPYDSLVQLSLSGIATLSFVSLSRFLKVFGLRRFLFFDKLCDESEIVRKGYTAQLNLVSVSLLAGLLILLRSATRITHKAQGVTSLVAKWHVCATIDVFETPEADIETPMVGAGRDQVFPSEASSSDYDDVGDEEDEFDNTKLIPAYAYSTISFQKRQALGTRPDLAYAVSRLSRYTSNPSYAHWKAITRVLHYLRYSRDYGLHYDRHPAVIEGYSDANWISDIKDSRSTSGYVFTLGGAAISWKSSKQTVIAKSTMESEFIALDKCGEEAEWLRQFVEDIPRWPKPVTAISIHCDSKSAMGRAKSTMYNGKSRHIRRRHNSIRQLLSTGVISIDYVASKDNIADPFTKGLSRELVSKSSKGMGLKPLKE
ncbi:zinc finger, CCHC-type containing protein [Tanacetum coccineum]